MNYKIVTFDDVYDNIAMPMSFWKKTNKMDKETKRIEVRNNLYWPDGFLDQLKGLSIDEQMEYYGISKNETYSKSSYGQITNKVDTNEVFKLSEYQGLNALIVEDDLIIGVCIDTYITSGSWGAPAFPYQDICTYIGSDNNGSGSSDSELYAHLFCIKK